MSNKILLSLLAIPLASTMVGGTAFASTTPIQPKSAVVNYSNSAGTAKTPTTSLDGKVKEKKGNNTAADKAYAQAVTNAQADYKSAITQAKANLKASLQVAKNTVDKKQANKVYKDSVKSASLAKTSALKEAKSIWKKAKGSQ